MCKRSDFHPWRIAKRECPLPPPLVTYIPSLCRYCLYPQELVLRMDPPARVRKLQLLSHQYMIGEGFLGGVISQALTSINIYFHVIGL